MEFLGKHTNIFNVFSLLEKFERTTKLRTIPRLVEKETRAKIFRVQERSDDGLKGHLRRMFKQCETIHSFDTYSV